MAFETIFLVVLIFSLVLGNALLSFFSISKRSLVASNSMTLVPLLSSNEKTQSADLHSGSFNNKIFLLAKQISVLNEKVSKFDDFKQNIRIEIKALSEMMEEFMEKQKKGKNNVKSQPKEQSKEDQLSTKDMHKIIFNSR